jgi:hypothetical protein
VAHDRDDQTREDQTHDDQQVTREVPPHQPPAGASVPEGAPATVSATEGLGAPGRRDRWRRAVRPTSRRGRGLLAAGAAVALLLVGGAGGFALGHADGDRGGDGGFAAQDGGRGGDDDGDRRGDRDGDDSAPPTSPSTGTATSSAPPTPTA